MPCPSGGSPLLGQPFVSPAPNSSVPLTLDPSYEKHPLDQRCLGKAQTRGHKGCDMGKFRFLLSILAIPLSILACSSDEDSSNQAPATGGTGGATTDATTDVEADTTLDAPSDSIADQQAEAPADVATQDVVEASDAPQETDIDADPDAQVDRPCTLLGQECEPGEKCSPEGKDDALVCRPDGDKSLGNACGENGFDDCLSGLACVEYSSKLSTCRPLCIDTASCPQPTAQSCEPWFGPAGAVAGVCLGDLCSPPSTGCKADERCTVLSVASRAVTACVPAGAVKVGGDCTVDECEPGAMCVHAGGKYVCRSFCHGGNDCNDDDLHCVWPWGDDVAFGLCRSGCDPVLLHGPGNGLHGLLVGRRIVARSRLQQYEPLSAWIRLRVGARLEPFQVLLPGLLRRLHALRGRHMHHDASHGGAEVLHAVVLALPLSLRVSKIRFPRLATASFWP